MDVRKLKSNQVHWTLILFSVLIYFQQVFVINVKSSFKLYEILSIIACAYLILKGMRYVNKRLIYYIFIFGLLPFATLFLGNFIVTDEIIQQYYLRFPDAKNHLRFNYHFASAVVLIFYFITLGASIFLYKHIEQTNVQKLIKLFVITGSIVSIYAIYGVTAVSILGLPDLIPDFLDNRNTRPDENMRPAGFSAEPGTFIYMLGWQLIFLVAYPQLFKRRWIRTLLICLVLVTILLTLSSLMVFLFASLVSTAFIAGYRWREKIYLSILFVSCMALIYVFAGIFLSYELINYIIFGRIEEFISLPKHTCGSGAFRSFTNFLGFSIFKDFPFGVGPSGSYFLMHIYEPGAGIVNYCEELDFSNAPQSTYVMVLAELGALGLIYLIALLLTYLFSFIKLNNHDCRLKHMALSGVIFTIFSLTAIYPVYNLFIWFPLILMDRAVNSE